MMVTLDFILTTDQNWSNDGDIYKGKIQGVITKDISRLEREHIGTSNYIERVFPSLNIRYIAILDGVGHIAQQRRARFKTL